jgi:hypothetical protein
MIEKALPIMDASTPDSEDAGTPVETSPLTVIDMGSEEGMDAPGIKELEDGSIEITFGKPDDDGKGCAFGDNLVDQLDEGALTRLATDLVADVESDIQSRSEWVETFVKGMETLGLKYEERTEPWVGACGVHSTVLTEAAVRFQSETIMETFPAAGPVRTEILGASDRLKEEAAKRVEADMNYELTCNMVEYRAEHERMLYSLGLGGSGFKKVYFDPNLGRAVSMFVPTEDMLINYGASNIETAERVTHVMRKTKNEIAKLQACGFYDDDDLGEPQQIHTDIEEAKAKDGGIEILDDPRYLLYEVHADVWIDGLEKDPEGKELARPYVVTIDKGSNKVIGLRRNWQEDDKKMLKRQHFVQYTYIPGFGLYGMGLIHLVGGYARAGTSIIRQLVDAGTLSNLPGGMKTRGLRILNDDKPIEPGQFKDVDVPSGTIRDNIMPLPYKEPSQVLAALLVTITDEGRRLGAIADMKVSDMSANAPVGTTLAILERQLKTMSAVQARVHFAMRREFTILKGILRDCSPEEYAYVADGGKRQALQEDYHIVDVVPVSDPNSSTMAQRIAQYQAAFQMSQQAPQVYDLPQLHRQMLDVIGIANASKIVALEEDKKPVDPVSENMAILRGKGAKAFMHQDHDAHIAIHSMFMQNPIMAKQLGQNPMAQQLMAALQAHIAEHLGFQYRKQIEEQLGVPLPPPDENLPPDMEVHLSTLVAQAAKQLLDQQKGMAAQQQAQQTAQDPLVQMQAQELQIKGQDVQRKAAKDAADNQIAQQKLQLQAQAQAADAQGGVAEKQQALVLKQQEGAQKLQQMSDQGQLKLAQGQAAIQQKMNAQVAPQPGVE